MSVPYQTISRPGTSIRMYENGLPTTTTDIQYYSYEEEKGFGMNTPNLKELRRLGKILPFTPWYQFSSKSTISGTGWVISRPTPTRVYTWSPKGNFWAHPIVTSEPVGALLASASIDLDASAYVTEAAARIYSSGWDALTFAAELRKTIDLVTGLGARLVKLLHEVRRRQTQGQALSKIWLEMRYGWRPLIYDIISIEDAIRNIDDQRKRFKERAGASYSTTKNFTHSFVSSAINGTGTLTFQDVFDVSLRGSVVADIQPPKIQFNPILTGWELIKFSFVIDWFLNIGQWLASMSFLALTREYQAGVGYQVSIVRSYIGASYSVKPGWTANYDCHLDARTTLVQRSPATIPLAPTTHIRLDTSKIIDMIMLVIQLKP